MLERMDQRDAAKGCTDLLALFGISDAPGQEASARLPRARSSDPHLAALAEIAGPVIAHRHHGITVGVAHYEVRAARAAAAAHSRMSHEDIASAMGLSGIADISSSGRVLSDEEWTDLFARHDQYRAPKISAPGSPSPPTEPGELAVVNCWRVPPPVPPPAGESARRGRASARAPRRCAAASPPAAHPCWTPAEPCPPGCRSRA